MKLTKKLERRLHKALHATTLNLVDLNTFVQNSGVTTRTIEPSHSIPSTPARFFGRESDRLTPEYSGETTAPHVSLVELSDVQVMGSTEFILYGRSAIYPAIIDPHRDVFTAEIQGRAHVDLENRRVRLWPRSRQLKVDRAVSLIGQCMGNYAHWITEALTRLVLVDEIPHLSDYPILIDHGIHPRLLEALAVVNRRSRPIIQVKPWQRVHVASLAYLTPPSYTPPDDRHHWKTGTLGEARPDAFLFSDTALAKLRSGTQDLASSFVQTTDARNRIPDITSIVLERTGGETAATTVEFADPSQKDLKQRTIFPKRIYLRRQLRNTGNGREIVNAFQVEMLLAEMGFCAIDPADLPFEQQALLLRDCEYVVAPIGAAVTNLAFAKPGCKVALLAPFYRNASYYYFFNFLAALGHTVAYVLGPQIPNSGPNLYHLNFMADLEALRGALAWLSETSGNSVSEP